MLKRNYEKNCIKKNINKNHDRRQKGEVIRFILTTRRSSFKSAPDRFLKLSWPWGERGEEFSVHAVADGEGFRGLSNSSLIRKKVLDRPSDGLGTRKIPGNHNDNGQSCL